MIQKGLPILRPMSILERGRNCAAISEAFGIDRRNAQTVIAQYREKYPQQLIYNESAKELNRVNLFNRILLKLTHIYI